MAGVGGSGICRTRSSHYVNNEKIPDTNVPTIKIRKYLNSIVNLNYKFNSKTHNNSLFIQVNSYNHKNIELVNLLQQFLIKKEEEQYNNLFVKESFGLIEITYPENEDLNLLTALKMEIKLSKSLSDYEYHKSKLIHLKNEIEHQKSQIRKLKNEKSKPKNNFKLEQL